MGIVRNRWKLRSTRVVIQRTSPVSEASGAAAAAGQCQSERDIFGPRNEMYPKKITTKIKVNTPIQRNPLRIGYNSVITLIKKC